MNDYDEVATGVPFAPVSKVDSENGFATGNGMSFLAFNWLTPSGTGVPPWWSAARDAWLRDLVGRSDPLKIAINTFVNKAVSIPMRVMARETTIKRHVAQAADMQRALTRNSGILKGFKGEFKKFLHDYLTQDNGAFMFVMGDGPGDQPLSGPAAGLIHLDSARCQRTGDPQFPIIYHHLDGRRYAIHVARVIAVSNLPSPKADMFEVGFCAASCAIDMALEVKDIYTYSSEKFGSRPPRQLLYAETGATIDQLSSAVHHFENKLTQEGLHRFAKTLLLAPKVANQELRLKTLDLSNAPDGFNRQEVTVLDLALLAAAFGLDLNDLAVPFGVAGASRVNAEAAALKGRGKGVHEILETFTERMEQVYLPEQLRLVFDVLDDEQDRQQAEIRNTRSQARERDMRAGLTTVRVERELMVESEEITDQMFREMELADGRTSDGLDILFLFHSPDPVHQKYLGELGDNPTDVMDNDPAVMTESITEQREAVFIDLEKTTNPDTYWKIREVLAALDQLQAMYDDVPQPMLVNDPVATNADNMGEQDDMATDQPTDPTGVTDPNAPPPDAVSQNGQEGQDAQDAQDAQDQTKDFFPTPEQLTADSLPEAVNAQVEEIVSRYGDQFDTIVKQAVNGEIGQSEADRLLGDLIGSILLLLFLKGADMSYGEAGIQEQAIVQNIISINMQSLQGFLDDIYSGMYSPTQLTLDSALRRVELWQNMASNAYFQGMLQRPDDPLIMWQRNPFKDSCKDCLRLNGQVHSASEWAASGWVPRSPGLACHGYNCGCSFVEVGSGSKRGTF